MKPKTRPEELAVLGGAPAFAQPLHVGRPNIGDKEKLLERIGEVIDRRWLTNDGPCVRELEEKIATLVGVKHCIAMCNATIALEIAVRAAGLRDEVIVPSYTFIATAHALQWQQVTPVFCDLDPVTHNIDPAKIESMITPRTTGIIGVHVWGRPCDVDAIEAIARRRNLKVIYDAAHAFGCSHQGKMVGVFGLAEVFSFHATKFFNTFEGGAVVTNDDTLAQTMKLMRNFGFAGLDNVIHVGTNGKMSEVSAAMGLTGLEHLDQFVAVNQRNYQAYRAGLADIPGLSLVRYDDREKCNYQYVVVEVDEGAAGLGRDGLVGALHAENVLARKYFWPGCHAMEPYRSLFPHAHLMLPVAKQVAARVFLLPTGTAVGEADIQVIASILRVCVANARGVASAMRASNEAAGPGGGAMLTAGPSAGRLRFSAVFPVYYNAGSLRRTFAEVSQVLEAHPAVASYECIFVDDGSGDESLAELLELRAAHPDNVKVIEFARNFGQVAALQAGSALAQGDVILNMSADLQDPPALITEMLDAYLAKGVDIVVGTRAGRDESIARRRTSAVFYWLMRKLSFANMPKGGFDFILFSRRVRDAMLSHYEANPFWQGKLLWSGYPIHFLSYHRAAREVGQSRWTFTKKVKYLIDGVMAYSYFPLRAMSITGLLTFLAGIVYSGWIVVEYFLRNTPFKGWSPIMILVLLLGGVQMLFLGIIGEYLWRTLDQVRNRPPYLIKRLHGVSAADEHAHAHKREAPPRCQGTNPLP